MQEYFCLFNDTTMSLFRQSDIDAALRNDVQPLNLLGA
jgi:hypothetical protein